MQKPSSTAESFVGNVFKYSIATWLGFVISGLALVIAGILGPDKTADPLTFMSATATVMNIGILGLDQSLLRFYAEPPTGHTGDALFAVCVRISMVVMLVLGAFFSLVCPQWLADTLSFGALGGGIVPLLFVNAALYMLTRYLSVLLRFDPAELKLYTLETLLMQGCFNLFYLLAGFFFDTPYAYAVLSIVSFAAVGGVFCVIKRRALALQKGSFCRPVLGRLVPYGLALAPTQIMLYLNSTFSLAFLGNTVGTTEKGVFSFGTRLAQMVSAIQAGFATFWGPYIFAHYKTEQQRIATVHDMLDLLIFGFYTCLLAAEDLLFWLFPAYSACLPIFPLLMLSVVFSILCEGTVYGIAIAKKPVYDTIGIALSSLGNIGLCLLLVPRFGLSGAALALAGANGGMFLFRTLVGQHFYRTVRSPVKTLAGWALCLGLTVAGYLLAGRFWVKAGVCAVALAAYCLLYKSELRRLVQFAGGLLQRIKRKPA